MGAFRRLWDSARIFVRLSSSAWGIEFRVSSPLKLPAGRRPTAKVKRTNRQNTSAAGNDPAVKVTRTRVRDFCLPFCLLSPFSARRNLRLQANLVVANSRAMQPESAATGCLNPASIRGKEDNSLQELRQKLQQHPSLIAEWEAAGEKVTDELLWRWVKAKGSVADAEACLIEHAQWRIALGPITEVPHQATAACCSA